MLITFRDEENAKFQLTVNQNQDEYFYVQVQLDVLNSMHGALPPQVFLVGPRLTAPLLKAESSGMNTGLLFYTRAIHVDMGI